MAENKESKIAGDLALPQRFTGTEEEQIKQIFSFLYQTIEKLNYILNTIDKKLNEKEDK